MKRLSALVLCFLFIFLILIPVFTDEELIATNNILITIDGKEITFNDNYPFIQDSRTMVPLRTLSENMGFEVSWDDPQIRLKKDDTTYLLTIGTNEVLINNNDKLLMDTKPILKNDRVFIPLRFIAEGFAYQISWDQSAQKVEIISKGTNDVILSGKNLPAINNYNNLKKLLDEYQSYYTYDSVLRNSMEDMAIPESAPLSVQKEAISGKGASDYSETNVQVKGIDEADIIKTDGKYIYQLRNNKISISHVYPPEAIKQLKSIEFEDKNFQANELYIDKNKLVIIGSTRYDHPVPEEEVIYKDLEINSRISIDAEIGIMPGDYQAFKRNSYLTKALVYDTTDINNVKYLRSVEVEGTYLSSRKVDNQLYLVANKYFYMDDIHIQPVYRDSLIGEKMRTVPYSAINYFPGYVYPNFISIISFNLEGSAKEATIKTYLGSGDNVYMSHNNIYVAASSYEDETAIFKFAVNKGALEYSGRGVVPGNVINQFSMDEHNEYFRIATSNWEGKSLNNVFVLDKQMKIVGELKGLAPNERIYSARFMGDKAYLVTFEIIDPLFVIDLSIPTNPKVLGELKIPGFSNYLHPLDDNHLLGIGRDTDVRTSNGREWVVEKGIKLAIFDVSDVNNPVEKFVKIIGGQGTYSEVLYNHKALLFNEKTGLMSFPITVRESDGSDFGSIYKFQGAFIFNVDVDGGITTLGDINHHSKEQSEGNDIRRILYIGDYLYTISDNMIKINNLSDLQHVSLLNLSN